MPVADSLVDRTYADNEITFTAAGVELELAADDYNLVRTDNYRFSVTGVACKLILDHIYIDFLDARRWYFE